MRTIISAIAFAALLAMSATATAEDEDEPAPDGRFVRVYLLDGVYSVEAPREWHLEVSGRDLTATFTNDREPAGMLIIAAPNPAAGDIGELTETAANAVMLPYGNGEMMQGKDDEMDGFPARTAWFVFNIGKTEFLGWVKTVDFSGIAVQAMTLAKTEDFEAFMETAAPVFDSLEINVGMVEENIDILREVGIKVVDDLKRVGAPR